MGKQFYQPFFNRVRQMWTRLPLAGRVIFACLVIAGLTGAIVFAAPRLPSMNAPGDRPPHQEESSSGQTITEPTPQTPPTPAPTAPNPQAPPAAAPTPSSVLGLTNWKLTLPTGKPDEIAQPALASFSKSPYFWLTSDQKGVVFQAHAGGATTSNSGYPRSELREMTNNGRDRASWNNASGTHTMTIRQAITHTPAAKPHVVAGQIHDASDDVIMIRLEGSVLFVEAKGKNIGVLEPSYKLGQAFTVKVQASGGRIKAFYNDAQKVDYAKSGSGFYFKAGCYTQSNPSKGDSPDAYGQVIIYALQVSHS